MKGQEKIREKAKTSGFGVLFIVLALIGISIFCFAYLEGLEWIGAVLIGIYCFISIGFVQIEPNESRVLMFFGKYVETLTDNGFFWVNPLYTKQKVTLRASNLDIEPIKVNDKMGNPILIGSVLVWKIKDTYKAMFNIDSSSAGKMKMVVYQNFVQTQGDAALRKVAGMYAYDNNENNDEDVVTLRSDGDEVSYMLEQELNSRLDIAGIEIVEARINYLAYAPEIASVMLRRQQAAAIISAREKIVEGAVSMVQLALNKLAAENIVELDEERKAAMVSNLLVVLCADEAVQPIVNAGTLHH